MEINILIVLGYPIFIDKIWATQNVFFFHRSFANDNSVRKQQWRQSEIVSKLQYVCAKRRLKVSNSQHGNNNSKKLFD